MAGQFDPQAILVQQSTEKGATRRKSCPQGEWSDAYIDSIKIRPVEIKKGERAGQTVYIANFLFDIQDKGCLAEAGRTKVICGKDVWLDLIDGPDGVPQLSWEGDDNVALGQLREAAGQNKDGIAWSLEMLAKTGPYVVRVTHSNRNNEDPEDIRAEVTRVIRQD